MIEAAEAAKTLSAPARTVEELYERLEVHIGQIIRVRTLKLDGDEHLRFPVGLRVATGELKWLHLTRKNGAIRVYFEDERAAMVPTNLRREVSVLIDGQWKIIHDPVELNRSVPGDGALNGLDAVRTLSGPSFRS